MENVPPPTNFSEWKIVPKGFNYKTFTAKAEKWLEQNNLNYDVLISTKSTEKGLEVHLFGRVQSTSKLNKLTEQLLEAIQ